MKLRKIKGRRRISLFLVLLCFALVAMSCSRSQAYRREQVQKKGEREKLIKKNISPLENPLKKEGELLGLKKRILVLPLWNDTPIKGKFSDLTKNELIKALDQEKSLIAIDTPKLSKTSKDFYIDQDQINLKKLVKLGSHERVSLIVVGRITRIIFRRKDEEIGIIRPSMSYAAAGLEIRLIGVEEAKESTVIKEVGMSNITSFNFLGGSLEENKKFRTTMVNRAIKDAIQSLLPKLYKKSQLISWQGQIAKILNQTIYISGGRVTGINIGDILSVSASGQEILDPETSRLLGKTKGEVKGTLEVISYFGEDGAVARIHSGSNFQLYDQVSLY